MAKELTPEQWREVSKSRTEAARKQLDGIESSEIFKLSVEAKLATLKPDTGWWRNFQKCGNQSVFAVCVCCGRVREFKYNCSLKWCPRCNWRIADRRRKELEATTCMMAHTKHIVLTQKNFDSDLLAKAKQSRKNLKKLQRQKIMGVVRGGCASMEFTNEDRGWHLHWHLLVDSDFVAADRLSIRWGELVGQDFAIVKVKSVKQGSYLQEVCKYAVKGSELAGWTPAQIYEFAEMCRRVRMFTVWGNFVEERKAAKIFLRQTRKPAEQCECGSTSMVVHEDEAAANRIAGKKYERGEF